MSSQGLIVSDDETWTRIQFRVQLKTQDDTVLDTSLQTGHTERDICVDICNGTETRQQNNEKQNNFISQNV